MLRRLKSGCSRYGSQRNSAGCPMNPFFPIGLFFRVRWGLAMVQSMSTKAVEFQPGSLDGAGRCGAGASRHRPLFLEGRKDTEPPIAGAFMLDTAPEMEAHLHSSRTMQLRFLAAKRRSPCPIAWAREFHLDASLLCSRGLEVFLPLPPWLMQLLLL